MTDITELAQSLKAAAEKATKGPWITFDDDFSDGEDAVVTNEARDDDCMSPVAVIKGGGSESDDDSPYCAEQRTNAEFIALASPANIRALVEALEKAQQRIDELENDEVRQRLANAEHQLHIAGLRFHNIKASRNAQFKKRKAAERRIAELESRTVTVKLPADRAAESESPEDDVSAWFDEGWNARGQADREALAAAGIKLEVE